MHGEKRCVQPALGTVMEMVQSSWPMPVGRGGCAATASANTAALQAWPGTRTIAMDGPT